jgi:hypothetical protein
MAHSNHPKHQMLALGLPEQENCRVKNSSHHAPAVMSARV